MAKSRVRRSSAPATQRIVIEPVSQVVANALAGATPRDEKRTRSHYRTLALLRARAFDRELRSGQLTKHAARDLLDCALALYSGGANPRSIKLVLRRAVLVELRRHQQLGYDLSSDSLVTSLELLAAAYVVDKNIAKRFAKSRLRCRWEKPLTAEAEATFAAAVSIWNTATPVVLTARQATALDKQDREAGSIAAVLARVTKLRKAKASTPQAFATAIDAYLATRSRDASKQYVGAWCFIGLALAIRFHSVGLCTSPLLARALALQ